MRNVETPPVAGRHRGTWGHMHPSTYVSGALMFMLGGSLCKRDRGVLVVCQEDNKQ